MAVEWQEKIRTNAAMRDDCIFGLLSSEEHGIQFKSVDHKVVSISGMLSNLLILNVCARGERNLILDILKSFCVTLIKCGSN